jgi:hypothetical protein
MSRRNRHRIGVHLVKDDESDFVYYSDEVATDYDGSVKHRSQIEGRHPQDFVRAKGDPYPVSPIRPDPDTIITDLSMPLFIGNTQLLTPVGPATHLYRTVVGDQILLGIGEMIIDAFGLAAFIVGDAQSSDVTEDMPVYIGTGVGDNAPVGTDITPEYLTGIQLNDKLILQYGHSNNAAMLDDTFTFPGDWNYLTSVIQQGTRQLLYWKDADGTETGSITISTVGDGLGRHSAVIHVFRNVEPGTSFYENLTFTRANSDIVTDAGITTNGDNRLACNFVNHSTSTPITPNGFTGQTGGTWQLNTYFSASIPALSLHTAGLLTPGTINGGSALDPLTGNWVNIGLALLPVS